MKKISKLWQKRHVKYQEIWDLETDAKSLKQQVDQKIILVSTVEKYEYRRS